MSSPDLAAAHPLILLFLALLLDAVVGDMRWLFSKVPHPIVLVGRLIGFLDYKLNRSKRIKAKLMIRGCIATILVTSLAVAAGHLCALAVGNLPFGEALEIFVIVVLVAQRSLYDHGHAVSTALKRDGIEAGRLAVSHIVGRDTTVLDEHGVARGAIESLAENFADGVVAPAFWYLILGLPGLFAYKVINTLDSMIGYKSERYRQFGLFAARLDDVVNLIPARFAAIFFVLASVVTPNTSPARATKIVWHDAGKHDSPNAGWPEAAMAGALNRALGGPRYYVGGVTKSQWIGDGDARSTARDIDRALILYGFACLIHAMFYAAVFAMVFWW